MTAIEKIRSIQDDYFQLIQSSFRDEISELKASPLEPMAYARDLLMPSASSLITPDRFTACEYRFLKLMEDLQAFWKENEASLAEAISNSGLMYVFRWQTYSGIERELVGIWFTSMRVA